MPSDDTLRIYRPFSFLVIVVNLPKSKPTEEFRFLHNDDWVKEPTRKIYTVNSLISTRDTSTETNAKSVWNKGTRSS